MRDYRFRVYNPADCTMTYNVGLDRISEYADETLVKMQQTGLKDKRGTNVYYKDKVYYEGQQYVVEWDEDRTGFYLAYWRHIDDPKSEEHLIGSCIRESEVIGNIFD